MVRHPVSRRSMEPPALANIAGACDRLDCDKVANEARLCGERAQPQGRDGAETARDRGETESIWQIKSKSF